ncbi:histidine kinase N-terminal 7TM domain-containing protein [Methanocalculus sp. MC3]
MPEVCMILESLLIFTCLLSAFITFGLGIFVYAKNPDTKTAIIFLAAMATATYWALGEFFIWQSTSYEGVQFWLKFSSLWPVLAAFAAHFILAFTNNPLSERRYLPHLLAILYLPAVIFSTLGSFTETMYTVVFDGARWVYEPIVFGPFYIASALFVVIVVIWAIYLIASAWFITPKGSIRRQNRLVCLGLLAAVGSGMISGIFLPLLGIAAPNFIFIGISIFSFCITVAIMRYGLFILKPETAGPDIIATMPDGLLLVEPEGRIISANTASYEIFGLQAGSLQGTAIQQILPEEICETIRMHEEQGGRIRDLEANPESIRGKAISIAASRVHSPDGEPAGCILIIRDITERKAAETALRVANEKVNWLTRLTRHDIANQVTALGGYLELLKEEDNPEKKERYLSQASLTVDTIISHLEFSREYQEIGAHDPVWQPLQFMIAQALENIQAEGITIIRHIEPIAIYADRLFVKVIYNLLENAIRHGDTIRTITISTAGQEEGSVLLTVEDDGTGIPDKEKELIFRYGYGKNTGFGLAFARDIASVTGITLIENGEAGRGARFVLTVPAHGWMETKDLTQF